MPHTLDINFPISYWIVFNLLILALLAIDLGIFHRKSHTVHFKEAVSWTIVWVALALCFNGWLWWRMNALHGPEIAHDAALMFFTGYIVEKALSVDNVFVFLLIFGYFQIPPKYQHRVLFYGILGALVMRAIFIYIGAEALERWGKMMYVFGGLLVVTGLRMFFTTHKRIEPEKNFVIRAFRKIIPVTPDFRRSHFFVREAGRVMATPLMVTLIFVEVSDLVFAVDSIPAILAITTNKFIVYTSNVFAILGLRALYFCLAGFMGLFRYLGPGLAIILIFIGGKMIWQRYTEGHFPISWSLGVIAGVLFISIGASIIAAWRDPRPLPETDPGSVHAENDPQTRNTETS